MKLLLDACVWSGARRDLEAAAHDVIWAGDWPQDPGDEDILARAYADRRVLVTLDKDFGELAVVFGRPHCGIIRLVDQRARLQGAACLAALKRYGAALEAGAIVTVEPGRLRIRPPEG